MKSLLSLAAALAVTAMQGRAQREHRVLMDEKTGSIVEVTSVFSAVPPTGYAPIRVKAVNNTGTDRAVTISAVSRAGGGFRDDGHRMESNFSLTAAANKTTEREFMVPLCANAADGSLHVYSAGSLSLDVDAGAGTNSVHIEAADDAGMSFIGFSAALAGRTIVDLNRALLASRSASRHFGNPDFAVLYNSGMLPSDWRGISGLDIMAITADEWTALAPGVKSAVLQWVRLGGALEIFQKDGAQGLDSLGIRIDTVPRGSPATAEAMLGLGSVTTRRWGGSELETSAAGLYNAREIPNRRRECGDALREYDDGKKQNYTSRAVPLVTALGEKNFAAWQVGLILFVFGILVGPVNLFYFARAGRRHKLFITTPLISLGAAVLLLLVIFFQDGTGGKGHRAALVYLDAAENAAFVRQFQVSRTGVLFGGSFTTADPAVVSMAVLPASRWTRLKLDDDAGYHGRGDQQRYSVSDKTHAGDWFQSRTEQAQIIDTVQSTRGRIELKPGGKGAPVIVSSLTAPLERVFYVDGSGKYWISPGKVTTGVETALTESSRGDFIAWTNEAGLMIPYEARRNLAVSEPVNFFFASSTDSRAGVVDTLDSIDWESDTVLIFGPLAAK